MTSVYRIMINLIVSLWNHAFIYLALAAQSSVGSNYSGTDEEHHEDFVEEGFNGLEESCIVVVKGLGTNRVVVLCHYLRRSSIEIS